MRTETFQAIQREIARDPLTERQAAELAGQDRNRLLDSKEAAEMLGVAPATLRNKARRHEILRVKTNGRQAFSALRMLWPSATRTPSNHQPTKGARQWSTSSQALSSPTSSASRP